MLGKEIGEVTAARQEVLAGTVRTLTFTVGVRWWGRASEGSEQRRMLLVVTGYCLAAEGEARRRASSRPLLGSTRAPSWDAAKVWFVMGDTGSALQGPPSLRGLKETPKGSGWVLPRLGCAEEVREDCLSASPCSPALAQRVCRWRGRAPGAGRL